MNKARTSCIGRGKAEIEIDKERAKEKGRWEIPMGV